MRDILRLLPRLDETATEFALRLAQNQGLPKAAPEQNFDKAMGRSWVDITSLLTFCGRIQFCSDASQDERR